MHPISVLQGALVAALRTDAALAAMVGGQVFDAPPKGAVTPYVAVARHDLLQRDGDAAPGQEHRILLHCWGDQPSRKRVLDIVERVLAVVAVCPVAGLVVTHREHVRTETVVDRDTGLARAAVTLRFFSELA